jgi:hypothetical protein
MGLPLQKAFNEQDRWPTTATLLVVVLGLIPASVGAVRIITNWCRPPANRQ